MKCLLGLFACISLLVPFPAVAQTVGATTGAINGKVVDASVRDDRLTVLFAPAQ